MRQAELNEIARRARVALKESWPRDPVQLLLKDDPKVGETLTAVQVSDGCWPLCAGGPLGHISPESIYGVTLRVEFEPRALLQWALEQGATRLEGE